MENQDRTTRITNYQNRVLFLKRQLRAKNKFWIKDFIARYYPQNVGDQSFYNKFTNFIKGLSYEAGYNDPGFMKQVEEYYQAINTN